MKKIVLILIILFSGFLFTGLSCSGSSGGNDSGGIKVTLTFERIDQVGPDPFKVTAAVTDDGTPLAGRDIVIDVPRGAITPVTDKGDGTYEFTVTPVSTGIYPVTVSYGGASIRRDALVVNQIIAGAGQPLLVPGMVNTSGYEDGITITPDGEYLFIQYGPLYFSGIFFHEEICAEAGYSRYCLGTCPPKDDSSWVFDTIGPYTSPLRPGFPTGGISSGKLTHLDIPLVDDSDPGNPVNIVDKIALFPTVFYGFKRQADGSFAQPFKVAFNDAKGANGPFGLSFKMTGPKTAVFVMAWNNYLNNFGDDGAEIYHGTITMEENTNLGDVIYSGEFYTSITPHVDPVGFISHAGVQGNPHLYYDVNGDIKSIWVDDEQASHDITVYVLTAGTFPGGTWTPVTLPSKINTGVSESQPFFTGSRLYLNREVRIVYHEFTGTHDEAGYADGSNWGNEVVVLASGDAGIDGIFGVGEPTIAEYDGKKWLYFAYVHTRAAGAGAGRFDYDLGAAFVEIP